MSKFRKYNPNELELKKTHQLLLGSVAPRPIGFTASKSKDGHINLAPFSFHNAFSSNPPIVGISPAFSGRTGKAKNTLTNILDTKEFTLSVVTHNMVEQMNICAAEYSSEINEFEKSGLHSYPSEIIAVPGVEESPLIMECQFTKHIQFSKDPAGGNLLLGEVVYFHAKEEVFDDNGNIDPKKVDQVSRMGMDWYSRANQGIFDLPAPKFLPIGIDNLPQSVKESPYFTGKLLARLAYIDSIPKPNITIDLKEKYSECNNDDLLRACANFLENNQIEKAWQLLYLGNII